MSSFPFWDWVKVTGLNYVNYDKSQLNRGVI